jgi:omega-6 fatty acid desaturase (delta-12 desaturase)
MTTAPVATDTDRPTGGRRSLKPVIDALPEAVYDNPTSRGLFYFGRDACMYVGLLVALTVVSSWWGVLLLEIPMALVVSGLFIVAHDSAHGALFKTKRLNSIIGHLSMLPSWHVYEGWVLGHNRVHHAFTVREGYDFVWQPTTPDQWQAKSAGRRLLHRIEWSWAGAGLYYAHEVWLNKMIVASPPARWVKATRRDRFIVLGFVVGMTALFTSIGLAMGNSAWGVVWLDVRTIVLPFLCFSYVIGSFVHVHHVDPDIRWWKSGEWDKFKAQMEGTTVLRAPKGLNFFIHWIMVHVPHHVDMRVPMYHLEEAAEAIEEAFPGTVIDKKLRFRDFVANTKACKLYDYDAACWRTYREGELASAPATLTSGVIDRAADAPVG